jgi:hypothetical protein
VIPDGTPERCPHCGVVTLIEPSGTLRYKCGVCGRARVPISDPTIERTYPEVDALRLASAARISSVAWRVAGFVALAFGLVGFAFLGLVLTLLSPGALATTLAFVATSTPVVFAAVALLRAKRKSGEVAGDLERGWELAAREVVEARGSLDAGSLAKLMRLPEADAERLLVRLSADSVVASRVGDDGSLAFDAVTPKVRVAPLATDVAAGADEGEALASDPSVDREARGRVP